MYVCMYVSMYNYVCRYLCMYNIIIINHTRKEAEGCIYKYNLSSQIEVGAFFDIKLWLINCYLHTESLAIFVNTLPASLLT